MNIYNLGLKKKALSISLNECFETQWWKKIFGPSKFILAVEYLINDFACVCVCVCVFQKVWLKQRHINKLILFVVYC